MTAEKVYSKQDFGGAVLLTNHGDPVNALDVANKEYVDGKVPTPIRLGSLNNTVRVYHQAYCEPIFQKTFVARSTTAYILVRIAAQSFGGAYPLWMVFTGVQPTLNDGVGNGTTTFTSASANFTNRDIGRTLTEVPTGGTHIPVNTTILYVNSPTSVLLNNSVASGTGISFQIGRDLFNATASGGNTGVTEYNISFTNTDLEALGNVHHPVYLTGLTIGRTYHLQVGSGMEGGAQVGGTVGKFPYFLDISPDQNSVWVSNNGDNTVQMFIPGFRPLWRQGNVPTAMSAERPIALPAAAATPYGIAVSPNGKYVALACGGTGGNTGALCIINALTGQVIGTTATGGAKPAWDVCWSQDSTTCYVSGQEGNVWPYTVSATAAPTKGAALTGGLLGAANDSIGRIAMAPDGVTLYVADASNGNIYQLNLTAAGTATKTTISIWNNVLYSGLFGTVATCQTYATLAASQAIPGAGGSLLAILPQVPSPDQYGSFPQQGTIQVPLSTGGYVTLAYNGINNVALTDGVGNGTSTFTSTTAQFNSNDVGKVITESLNVHIPANTTIISVTNATTVVLSANVSSGTGIAFTVAGKNAISFLNCYGGSGSQTGPTSIPAWPGTINLFIDNGVYTAGNHLALYIPQGGPWAPSFTDGVTSASSAVFTSATANFTQADVGKMVYEASGVHIGLNSYILSVQSPTSCTLNANALAAGSGITFFIVRKGLFNNDGDHLYEGIDVTADNLEIWVCSTTKAGSIRTNDFQVDINGGFADFRPWVPTDIRVTTDDYVFSTMYQSGIPGQVFVWLSGYAYINPNTNVSAYQCLWLPFGFINVDAFGVSAT